MSELLIAGDFLLIKKNHSAPPATSKHALRTKEERNVEKGGSERFKWFKREHETLTPFFSPLSLSPLHNVRIINKMREEEKERVALVKHRVAWF